MSQHHAEMRGVALGELLREVAGSWRLVLIFSAALAFLGLAIGFWRPREYEASALLLPVSDQQGVGGGGGLAALASRYAGVAALAGVSVGAGGSSEETTAVLKSRQLVARYIDSVGLLPVLYAKDWDAVHNRWTSAKPRSLWEATERFRKDVMFVSHDAKSGLIQLTVTWTDPAMAAKWANGLVQVTNQFLRDRALAESDRNITYLTGESQKSTLVEARQAMFEVMRDEINRQMLARGRQEFALRVLDPADVSERPSSPGPVKLFMLLGLSGTFLGILFVLGRRILRD